MANKICQPINESTTTCCDFKLFFASLPGANLCTFFFFHSCVVFLFLKLFVVWEMKWAELRKISHCHCLVYVPSLIPFTVRHIGHVPKSENISTRWLWFICHGGFKLTPRCYSKEESQATSHNCGRVSLPQNSHQLIDGHPFIYLISVPCFLFPSGAHESEKCIMLSFGWIDFWKCSLWATAIDPAMQILFFPPGVYSSS